MRALILTHARLDGTTGAGQVALELGEALRARGHDITLRSTEPLPPGTRWWNTWKRQRAACAEIARSEGPFDLIDTPAISASSTLGRCGNIAVRSVQPELRYLWLEVREDLLRHPGPRSMAHAVLALPRDRAIRQGWKLARVLLCQGQDELSWMRAHHPRLAPKLRPFRIAPPAADRSALAGLRDARPHGKGSPTRFLWIGRWSAQKGTRKLERLIEQRLHDAPSDRFTIAGCGSRPADEIPPEWLRSETVTLIPTFSRRELPELLAGHQVGLFTSLVEGWGLSLQEMLESGMTVYASPTGAVRDLQPFFPTQLRRFPIPRHIDLTIDHQTWNAYQAEFDWTVIARDYELATMGMRSLA
jgi:glycosyltransferase involved in cell wall biosynthesis